MQNKYKNKKTQVDMYIFDSAKEAQRYRELKLLERAKKHTQELKSELKNITKLKDIIEQYLKGKETTIKTVMLSELSKDLEVIIELMNNESNIEV